MARCTRLTEYRFEKHATVPFLEDCQVLFTKKYENVGERITGLNKVVGALFLEANKECEKHGFPLLEGDGYLTDSLKKAFADQGSDIHPAETGHTGAAGDNAVCSLDASATVAIAAASEGASELSIAGAHNQAATPCMNESVPGTTNNAFEACGLSTAGARIHTSMPGEMPLIPIGIYEQTRKSRWDINAMDSWPQQVAAPATPCISRNSAQRCPQAGPGNVDVTMEVENLRSQWCSPGDQSERQQPITSNLPPYNSPAQADQNFAADRDLATEDWNEAMQHALTQFEDGTTDEWDRATRDALAQFGDFLSTT
jgi:hypothetical protein